MFCIFLLITSIVGTRLNSLNEAVQTSTPNQCFSAKIMHTPAHPCFTSYIKVGFKGVTFTQVCYPDVYQVLVK